MILISFVMIIVIFLSYFSYIKIAEIVTEDNENYNNKIIHQVLNNISSNCDAINRILTSIAYNDVVTEYLSEVEPLPKYELFNKLNNFLDNMMNVRDGIVDIVVVADTGNSYDLNGFTDFCRQIENDITFSRENKYYYSSLLNNTGSKSAGDYVVACTEILSLNNQYRYGEKYGIVYMVLEPNAIIDEEYYNDNGTGTFIYLMDRSTNVFYNNNGPFLDMDLIVSSNSFSRQVINTFRSEVDNEDSKIQIGAINQIDGWIICITPMKEILKNVYIIRRIEIYVLIIAMLMMAIPFRIIVRNITDPLNKLISFMAGISSGNLRNLKKRVDLDGYAETVILARHFNTMLDEIDMLTRRLLDTNKRLYATELEKKQSELAFLRNQINPHFLYNTFESIKGIASARGVPEIRQMMSALISVFKYSTKGASVVALKDEVETIRSYIIIQQIRFNDRFDVIYEFNEDILDLPIPKMILQPIVENAVFHGLEPKLGKGNLWVGGDYFGEDEIVLWVRDDGVGLKNDDLALISEKLDSALGKYEHNDKKSSSIGLENVNNRIKLLCGDSFGISVSYIQGEYTQVLVRLPVRRDTYK